MTLQTFHDWLRPGYYKYLGSLGCPGHLALPRRYTTGCAQDIRETRLLMTGEDATRVKHTWRRYRWVFWNPRFFLTTPRRPDTKRVQRKSVTFSFYALVFFEYAQIRQICDQPYPHEHAERQKSCHYVQTGVCLYTEVIWWNVETISFFVVLAPHKKGLSRVIVS